MIVVNSEPGLRPAIGPYTAGLRLSASEYDAVPSADFDENYRYELIRGVLVVTPPPSSAERSPNDELGRLLRNYQKDHKQGKALDATYPEHELSIGEDRRRADRAIWTGLGKPPDEENDVPAIVIEFVSSGMKSWRRDYQDKREQYLSVGVQEYWVIDRFERTMTVFRRSQAGPEESVVREPEAYRTSLLPGFKLPLAALFAEADLCVPKSKTRRSSKGRKKS